MPSEIYNALNKADRSSDIELIMDLNPQLKNLDIDSTSDAFKSFAQDALNAGNITEEEFAAALKGTISPLDLMEKAAKTSSTNLKKLYKIIL